MLKVYLCVGCPGSGKTTWSKQFISGKPEVVRLCPDEFRAKFGWGEADQSVSSQAFAATRSGMEQALSDGKDVLIDATSMHRKSRKDFIAIADKYKANKIAIVFEATRDTLIERNKLRGESGGRMVPTDVIDRMINNYETPTKSEFNTVIFISKTNGGVSISNI